MITPDISSGEFRRKTTARQNIKSGPINQFNTKEKLNNLLSDNTSGKDLKSTLARGGYIIAISPMAIGIFTSLIDSPPIKPETPGANAPSVNPNIIARRIQTVKYLSKNPSSFTLCS